MKFSVLNRYKGNNKPTSFHAVFGCREAQIYSLADEEGNARPVFPFPLAGGVLLLPVVENKGFIEGGTFTAEVFFSGKLYFGRAYSNGQTAYWKAKTYDDIDNAILSALSQLG